jgi:hypothetical protein
VTLRLKNFGDPRSNATILLLPFRCYCHNMFRSYDHQVADSGVLSQAVCLTVIAVSWISNHEMWLPW